MKLRIMGTAAAEGIPAMYCNCGLCQKALALGGKNIRTRQQALIDGELLVDFGPETYAHLLAAGMNMAGIGHILVTHSDCDHLVADNFYSRRPGFAYAPRYDKIHVWASGAVCAKIASSVLREELEAGYVLESMEPYRTYLVGGHRVTGFPAVHMRPEDEARIYLIEKDGAALLYCLDTGILRDEIFYGWFAEHGTALGAIVFDCTKGDRPQDYYIHMGMEENKEMLERLIAVGAASCDTPCICTHFSHNCRATHEELVSAAQKYGFTVAYDGLETEIRPTNA